MRNYFANIPQIDNFLRVPSEEISTNDSIFNDHDYGNTQFPGLINDSSFGFPDKKQYIFHTTDIANMLVLHSNNMIVPMRQKMSLRSNYNLHTEFGRQNGDGVYIVDYYNISRQFGNTDDFISSLLDYYITSGNVYPDQLHIKEKITEKLAVMRGYRGASPNFTIRIVTFIPQEYIMQYGLVYVPTSDLVVGSCVLSNEIVHPSSNLYRTYARTLESDVHNYIEISLVDPYGGNRPYYMNVGNKIYTIMSQPMSNNRPAGCIINSYRNQEITTSDMAEYNEIGEKLGIYPTIELAQTAGKLELINEANKLQLDLDRVQLDRNKLEYEKLKLERDLLKTETEHKKFEAQMELEMEKINMTAATLEFENKKLKLKHEELEVEVEKMKEKHEHELKLRELELEMAIKEKEKLEIRTEYEKFSSIFDLAKTYIKNNYELLYTELDIKKKLIDIVSNREKHAQEKEILESRQKERDLATIGSFVGLANNILKTI